MSSRTIEYADKPSDNAKQAEAFENCVETVTRSVKRKRDQLYALETKDSWESYFHHLYDNLVEVCAANLFLKEYLQTQVSQIELQEKSRQRLAAIKNIPKCVETKSLVDDGKPVVVASRKTPLDDLKNKYGSNIKVIDISPSGFYRRLHPSFPIKDVVIPNTKSHMTASSVLGLYLGLRLFELSKSISISAIIAESMRISRNSTKKTGPIIGYQDGIPSKGMLDEITARYKLYIEPYHEMLERTEQKELLNSLKELLAKDPTLRLVLVDNNLPNLDWTDTEHEISPSALIRDYLLNTWPEWKEAGSESEGESEEESESESE